MNRKPLLILLSFIIPVCACRFQEPEKSQNRNDTTGKSKTDTTKSKKNKSDNKVYYTHIDAHGL